MTYETIQLDKNPAGVALVWLNRPDIRNAINGAVNLLTKAWKVNNCPASKRGKKWAQM